MLQEKLGDVDIISEEESEGIQEAYERSEKEILQVSTETGEPSTEEDLVGVTQVAYIDPTPEPTDENPENITLPMETDHLNKEACTLVTEMQMKKENTEIENADERDDEPIEEDLLNSRNIFIMDNGEAAIMEDQQPVMEDQDLEAIADAVKATLATHPGLCFYYFY